MSGMFQGHLLLGPVTHELMLEDSAAKLLGDFQCRIITSRIQQYDLIRPLDAVKTCGQSLVVVVGRHKD